jgi:hypothetical protein
LYCNHQMHRDFWSPCICSILVNLNLDSVSSTCPLYATPHRVPAAIVPVRTDTEEFYGLGNFARNGSELGLCQSFGCNGGNTACWRQEYLERATNGEREPSQGSVGLTGRLLTASGRRLGARLFERLQADKTFLHWNEISGLGTIHPTRPHASNTARLPVKIYKIYDLLTMPQSHSEIDGRLGSLLRGYHTFAPRP